MGIENGRESPDGFIGGTGNRKKKGKWETAPHKSRNNVDPRKRRSGELMFSKVKGEKNPADLMTKGLGVRVIDAQMRRIGQEYRMGRAETGLKLT